MRVAAHDDALLAAQGRQPLGIRQQPVPGADPRGAVGDEDVLAHHVGVVGLDPVPEVAVVHGDGAGADAQDLLARSRLMRVVAFQVLFPVAAGHVHEVSHLRARQVGEPVADAHAQRQLGREHPVRGGARAVRVPPVAVGVARPHEEVGADDLEHLAVQVVGVADVARMVDQLRDRRVGLHGVGHAVVGRALHVVGVARAHPVDGVAVVGDLVRGECVLQDHDAALGELPPLFAVEAVRGDAVGAHALPPVRGAGRQDVG